MKKFDYNRTDIHIRYDQARRLPEKTMQLWLESISQHIPKDEVKTIIDVGCGTGRFSKALADHFSAKVYGIDPSYKMLKKAKSSILSPLVDFIQCQAANIPLCDKRTDMLFLSQVFHHIHNKDNAALEFKRVLKRDGFLCIRNSTTDSLDCYIYLRFFPSARKIDLAKLPSRRELKNFLHGHGFKLCTHTIVHQVFADNFDEYLRKISMRALSDLDAITDEEFQEGLTRLKKYCQEQKSQEPIFEDLDLFIFRLT
ncbi:MAG: class I SAM-dependent methyltransferase [candidate division WOR-3 bacterium]|nr:MAG: class I SAM-dependent methyltransferase [candidate division WOR-3 bacterium]